MSDTVQIPEDEFIPYGKEWKKEIMKTSKSFMVDFIRKLLIQKQTSQEKIKSFRKKLENITIDELLKNTGIILELFDEHFGIKK